MTLMFFGSVKDKHNIDLIYILNLYFFFFGETFYLDFKHDPWISLEPIIIKLKYVHIQYKRFVTQNVE